MRRARDEQPGRGRLWLSGNLLHRLDLILPVAMDGYRPQAAGHGLLVESPFNRIGTQLPVAISAEQALA